MDWDKVISALEGGDKTAAVSLFEGAVESAISTEVDGLKRKNHELLGKLRLQKDRNEELDDAFRKLSERMEAVEEARTIEAEGEDSAVVQKLAEEIAQRRYAKLEEAQQGEMEELRQQLAQRDEALESTGSRYRDLMKRQALLGRARKLGLNEDLENEFLGRLSPYLTVETGEDGTDRILAMDGGAIIPGSGHQGSATPEELVEMLYNSKGSSPYSSRGKGFFMVNPTPAPDVPAGEVTEKDIAAMSQTEFEAWREKGSS